MNLLYRRPDIWGAHLCIIILSTPTEALSQAVVDLGTVIDDGRVTLVSVRGSGMAPEPVLEAEVRNETRRTLRISSTLSEPLFLTNLGCGPDRRATRVYSANINDGVAAREEFIEVQPRASSSVSFSTHAATDFNSHCEFDYTYTREEPAAGRTSPTTFTVRIDVDLDAELVAWREDVEDEDGYLGHNVQQWTDCHIQDVRNWECGRPPAALIMADGQLIYRYWSEVRVFTAERRTAEIVEFSVSDQGEARTAASALLRATEQCFYDVRDRDLTWEGSMDCQGLGSLASDYSALGGFGVQELDTDIVLIAEKARSTAWMARATSLSPGQPLRIW